LDFECTIPAIIIPVEIDRIQLSNLPGEITLNKKFIWYFKLTIVMSLFFVQTSANGYDITDKFSIGGILAGAYQYQWVDGDDNIGRGAVPFEPEISFRPTANDEIFAKFGFAAGNGLNDVTEFNLSPWAAPLEDDVKDINGRNRDYLLTAWYMHIFEFSENNALEMIGGIIDATDYVDENAYANDEFTQFMNTALVNGPNGFAPSFDIGGAVEWEIGIWEFTAVGMNVGENDDGKWYGHEEDNIGIGCAYLDGKNDFNCTQVAEAYWRFVLNDYVAVTVDAQYMQDEYETDEDDIDGFILGIRGAVDF